MKKNITPKSLILGLLQATNNQAIPVRDLQTKMEQSGKHFSKMPLEDALIESFIVGSEAIYLLVTDPLLPTQMMDNALRVALTNAMLRYDELGKQIWSREFTEIKISQSPAHLKLVS